MLGNSDACHFDSTWQAQEWLRIDGRHVNSVRLAEAQVEAVTVENSPPEVIPGHQASMSRLLIQGLQMPQLSRWLRRLLRPSVNGPSTISQRRRFARG